MKSHTMASDPIFTAIILAGDRAKDDPVAQLYGTGCKAMVPLGGKPMILRVLHALGASRTIGTRVLCGPPRQVVTQNSELKAGLDAGDWRWVENQSTPSLSANHALESLSDKLPVLLTTADHALLSNEIVDYFCLNAIRSGFDLAVALTPYQQVIAEHPGVRRTGYRFMDDTYCGCNLFAFITPRSRKAAVFWRRVEQQRKYPWRVIGVLGWAAMLRFLLGRLSMTEALQILSKRLGINIGPIILPFPEAAVDVDTVADWEYVQRILADDELIENRPSDSLPKP